MKKILALLVFGISMSLTAGDITWETNFEKAKELAKKENKSILINFTGSDWCGWCKRLDREVFSKEVFASFADDSLVLLKIDFPKFTKLPEEQQRYNYELYEKYGVLGFPTIYLVDANGKVLLQTGYQRGGADAYVKHLKARM